MSKFVLTAQLNLQAPRNTNQVLNQIRNDFKGISVPVELQGGKDASRTAKDLTKNLKDATNASNKLAKSFVASTRRFLAFAAAGRALSLVTNNLSNAVSEAIDFERELIKISQVTGKTVKELGSLNREIKNLSTSLGVNSTQLLSVGRILSQAGFKARELEIALTALAKTELAPTFENIEQTAEGVVAIFNQFRKGAEALEAQLGAINAVAGKFAVESGDLISAVRRVGGVFESAGGSLEELLGLFTSVRATTRESAESIATGLRTILTRIQRPKTIEFLKQFGVELEGLDGKFVGPFEAVKRLSAALDDLPKGSLEFVRIAEELGGFRQIGKVIPLLQQFNVAERARQAAIAGSKSLDEDAAKAQQALAVQIQKTREQFSALVRDVVQSNTFKVLAAGALSFANALIQIGNAIKPILPLLTVLGGVKLGGFALNLGKATIGSLKSFAAQGRNQGGIIEPLAFNSGGLVPGSGNRDTVPAMLTPGEFVIKKSSVEKIGAGRLAQANKYAEGGKIVGKKTKKQASHIGASQELDDDQLRTYFSVRGGLTRTGGVKKLKRSLATALGIDTTTKDSNGKESNLPDAVIFGKPYQEALSAKINSNPQELAKAIDLQPKYRARLNWPASFNQALRRGNKDLVSQKELSEVTAAAKNIVNLDGIKGNLKADQQKSVGAALAKEIKNLETKVIDSRNNRSDTKNAEGEYKKIKAFDTDDQLNSLFAVFEQTVGDAIATDVKSTTDFTFKGGRFITSKGKARTSQDRDEKQNFAKIAQKLNVGGIVNEKDVGAAILEAGGSESGSISVSQAEVNKKLGFSGLARGASPADRYFSGKSFGVQKQGLNKDTSEKFSEALKVGFAAGTDNAVAAVAGDLGLPPAPIPKTDIDNFYSGVRTSLIGDLFEASLRSLKGAGRFSTKEDPGRPFDFVGGLGAASDNFPSVSSLNYVDAKSTFDAASDKEIKKKAVNQIAFELEGAGVKNQPVGTKKALQNRGIEVPDLPGFKKRKGFATGGPAGSDTVPAMLTPGEFVINRKSAQQIGYGNLNRMNKQGVMGFAKGGPVPGVQYLQDAGSVGNQFTGPFEVTSAAITGAIDSSTQILSQQIIDSAFSLSESFEVITDYFQSSDNSQINVVSPEIISALQQVASDVGNRLGPVLDQTNNTLERVITEIQNGNSLISDATVAIKDSIASLGQSFTDQAGVDAATGSANKPDVFEVASGSEIALVATTMDTLSSQTADKIGAILGAGPDATGGGSPASDVSFDGTAQSIADLQGDLQARIEELTQKSADAAANGFPLLQAKIEEGINSLIELQADTALQAASQSNLDRENKNLELLKEIDTSDLEKNLAQVDDLRGYIERLNAVISEAEQTGGNVVTQTPDGTIVRTLEEAADVVAELNAEFKELQEETTALSQNLQASDEAILENVEAYNRSQAELAENFQIANERDNSKCVNLCPDSLQGAAGFQGVTPPSGQVDAATGEEEKKEESGKSSILDNSFFKLTATVTALNTGFSFFTKNIDENSSAAAKGLKAVGESAIQTGTAIATFTTGLTSLASSITGAEVKFKDFFSNEKKFKVTDEEGNEKLGSLQEKFKESGEKFSKKLSEFGDTLEDKGGLFNKGLSKFSKGLGKVGGGLTKVGAGLGRLVAGVIIAAKVTGFLATAIDNITGVNREAEQAIKKGNIERARTTAIEAQRAKDVNKFAQGLAAGGAAIGSFFGPVGTAIGGLIGGIVGLGIKIASLTGAFDGIIDSIRNSSIAAALGFSSTEEIGAQAAFQAAQERDKQQESRNKLDEDRARERISAGESSFTEEFTSGNLTKNLTNQLQTQAIGLQQNAAARRRNERASSSSAGLFVNQVSSLFGGETLADEQDRLARESDKANADVVNSFRSNIDIYKDAAAGFASAGASADDIKAKLRESLGPFLDELEGTQAFDDIQKEFQNVADRAVKAAEKQREYIKSLNFGLAGVNNNIQAVTSSFSLLDQAATTGVTKFEIAAAKLETALSSAAGSLSPDEIEDTVDTIRDSIISAGGTEKQAAKVEDQFRGFQQIFSKFDESGGGFEKLKKDILELDRSESGSPEFKKQLAEALTAGVQDEDVKTRVRAAVNSGELDATALAQLAEGDLSPLEKLLGPTFEKFQQDTGGIITKVNEAQRSLISSINARKAAEDSLVEAQRKTIDLQIEAAGLLDSLRPKALGAPSAEVLKARNEGFARERFNVGARVSGGRTLTTGSTSDIRGSLQFLRNRQVNSRTERNRLAVAGEATASVEQAEADQNARDAAQAEELLTFTRSRIQEEQKLIETIKQRNAAEKSALESLLAGDIEAFIKQQEAAGAAAALETGSASLAGLFDAGALGAGALALQERGALTSDAANLALSAFGVNNPQAGQVLAEQTPEIQAAQREIESLAQLLPEFGKALEDIKRTEIKAEQAIINAKQLKLDNLRRDAEANPAGVAETLATTVGAAKEVVEGAKALDNGLAITSKAVGDSASLLGEAVQNLANSTLDVNINGDFVKGLVNPQDIVSALTSQIVPVIAQQIKEGLKNSKTGLDGDPKPAPTPQSN